MNILINMGTLKKGGGLNVGLNFLSSLNESLYSEHRFFYIVAKESKIHLFIKNKPKSCYLAFSNNPFARILQEKLFSVWFLKKHKIDIIYTYFGYGSFPRKYKQVCGVADSNLFFPEIDFWKDYNSLVKIYKGLIDKYRLKGYNNVNGLIFENKAMHDRYTENPKKNCQSIFIQPSITVFEKRAEPVRENSFENRNTAKGLFLCGWQLNKNIMLIPRIIHECQLIGINLLISISTTNDGSKISELFVDLCNQYDVIDKVTFLGTIEKEELHNVYENTDFVFLLSQLESFSNNIIESWFYKRALVVSNLEWAQSICKKAAIYVNRDSADEIAQAIRNGMQDSVYQKIVQSGIEELSTYHDIKTKIKKEIAFLEQVTHSN